MRKNLFRQGLERLPVLHHLRQVRVSRPEARRLRPRHRRPPRPPEDRERPGGSQQQAQDRHLHLGMRADVIRLYWTYLHFCVTKIN